MRTRRFLAPLIVAAVALLAVDAAHARFMPAQGTPVDRLVKNITAYVAEHPKDANAHYLLGRVHALAFRHNRSIVGIYPKRGPAGQAGLPNVAADARQPWLRTPPQPVKPGEKPAKPEPLTDEQKIAHVAASIVAYKKAIELDPKPAHYHNGLAFVLDKGREFSDRVAPPDVRSTDGNPRYAEAAKDFKELKLPDDDGHDARRDTLKTFWREAAIEKYLDAYNRSNAKDAERQSKPLTGLNSLVSYEAGKAYIALINSRNMTEGEKQSLASVQKHIAALDGLRRGPVTPIIFRLDRAMPLDMMLKPDRIVRFDLDGDGTAERRPWVDPDTAILCWDPTRSGKITSGKQLFGSVTFHLYPGDGYTAMNLLDDNRDGELAGSELPGLALWFDRNSNGVSDPGEVTPIEDTPVKALSVRALTKEGIAPANPFGLKLKDGRTLPTFDWIAPAVADDE